MREQTPVALPWAVVFGFVRLTTHPSVLASPLTRGVGRFPGLRLRNPLA